jgi:transposase
MIDYHLFCQIKEAQGKGLSIRQIARTVGLTRRAVRRWCKRDRFEQAKRTVRPSKLDAHKGVIARWLDQHPFTASQLLHKLRADGYTGGYSILRAHVARIRPRKLEAFLRVSYAPGECAQVDWGSFGSVRVGQTKRALSFFVFVLCHSRWMYVEFTLGQSMEWFLGCQQRAFRRLGKVPRVVIVDNCKTAVLSHPLGGPVQYNPGYLDFAQHYGFEVRACGPRHPQSKGIVENAVAYVKGNFLSGMQPTDFAAMEPAVKLWLDEVANVRRHGETKREPQALLAEDLAGMKDMPAMPYEAVLTKPAQACRRCRVKVDGNQYTVPPRWAGQKLTAQLSSERLRVFAGTELVCEHVRSFEKGRDFENPDHVKDLQERRSQAKKERILARFLALSEHAASYRAGLMERRFNAPHHLEKIVALSEIHGVEPVARALQDACELGAYSSEYITNLVEQRRRLRPEAGTLHLTRASDMLDLELAAPDLSLYEPGRASP